MAAAICWHIPKVKPERDQSLLLGRVYSMGFTQVMGVGMLTYMVMAAVVAMAAFLQGVGGVGLARLAVPGAVMIAP